MKFLLFLNIIWFSIILFTYSQSPNIYLVEQLTKLTSKNEKLKDNLSKTKINYQKSKGTLKDVQEEKKLLENELQSYNESIEKEMEMKKFYKFFNDPDIKKQIKEVKFNIDNLLKNKLISEIIGSSEARISEKSSVFDTKVNNILNDIHEIVNFN
jgi:hypothetical protein